MSRKPDSTRRPGGSPCTISGVKERSCVRCLRPIVAGGAVWNGRGSWHAACYVDDALELASLLRYSADWL